VFLLRKVRALMLEPYVTQAVVMGAASGYLLIGYLGAFLLHTLLLWQPSAFSINQIAPGIDPIQAPLHAFPSMVMASFGALTSTGAEIGRPGEVLADTGCMAITIVSQLYGAVLIALILGRFHRRSFRGSAGSFAPRPAPQHREQLLEQLRQRRLANDPLS
jgi:hypothetical protein